MKCLCGKGFLLTPRKNKNNDKECSCGIIYLPKRDISLKYIKLIFNYGFCRYFSKYQIIIWKNTKHSHNLIMIYENSKEQDCGFDDYLICLSDVSDNFYLDNDKILTKIKLHYLLK
jgi:hypothetical protein